MFWFSSSQLLNNIIAASMIKILNPFLICHNKYQHFSSNFNFSNLNKDTKKIQTIGFANSNIENIKNLRYKAKKTIKYQNGKHTIYKSKPSYWRVVKAYVIYVSAIIYLSYILYSRKYVDTYPIAKHMYVGGIAVIVFLMTRKFLHHQNIVKEINLLQGGKATEIVFQNQFKRRLFGQITSKTLYNSLFVSPKQSQEQFATLNAFPKDLRVEEGRQMSSYWKKYYSNYQNYILIPIDGQLIDRQILVYVYGCRAKQ